MKWLKAFVCRKDNVPGEKEPDVKIERWPCTKVTIADLKVALEVHKRLQQKFGNRAVTFQVRRTPDEAMPPVAVIRLARRSENLTDFIVAEFRNRLIESGLSAVRR